MTKYGSTINMYCTDCSTSPKHDSTSTIYGMDCSTITKYDTEYITRTYKYTVCT